jgi:hypothetical protein
MRLATFGDVLKAVASHVNASGHQDIRMYEEIGLAGFQCRECNAPWTQWVAPAETVVMLPKVLQAKTPAAKIRVLRSVVKLALQPRPYCPTSWERLNRF